MQRQIVDARRQVHVVGDRAPTRLEAEQFDIEARHGVQVAGRRAPDGEGLRGTTDVVFSIHGIALKCRIEIDSYAT